MLAHPTFGYRRIWAMLRFREGVRVNRKAVYRILRLKGWFVHQRTVTPRPRVQKRRSRADRSDQRWAMDVTHVPCGRGGWGHLAAVIDCHDREIVGWEFALRGRAKEAERALEEACIGRFGTLRPEGRTPVVRSDNGLIFQSRRFRAACRDYRLRQDRDEGRLAALFGEGEVDTDAEGEEGEREPSDDDGAVLNAPLSSRSGLCAIGVPSAHCHHAAAHSE